MTLAARYQSYKLWCVKHELPFLAIQAYEKQLAKIPDAVITNADFILMNGKTKRRRRDNYRPTQTR